MMDIHTDSLELDLKSGCQALLTITAPHPIRSCHSKCHFEKHEEREPSIMYIITIAYMEYKKEIASFTLTLKIS